MIKFFLSVCGKCDRKSKYPQFKDLFRTKIAADRRAKTTIKADRSEFYNWHVLEVFFYFLLFFFFTFYSATGANNNKCDHWWRRRLAKFENFPLCLTHSLLISIKGFSLTLILRSQLPRICFFLSFLNLVLVYAALTTNVTNGERAGERYIFGGETHTHTLALAEEGERTRERTRR